MLIGTHDFSSFRAAECQAKSPVKTLARARVARRGDVVRFDLSANAFLHHMVRNIVGALVTVGAGRAPPSWIGELLEARDRTRGPRDVRARRPLLLRAPTTTRASGCRRHAARSLAMRTRVKICGITRVADALAACDAGADAIGLIFWSGTPRFVEVGPRARDRRRDAAVRDEGRRCSSIPNAAQVRAILDAVPLDALQFHGTEDPDLCRGFGRPYLKAVHMKDGVDLLEYAALYDDAAGLVFDSYWPGDLPGGTGRAFDWSRLSADVRAKLPAPVILSGGLDAAQRRATRSAKCGRGRSMCRAASKSVGPDGKARRGLKDASRIEAFMNGVRNADD